MAIRRAKKKTNFTMISNVGLKDKSLSFRAKGLLAYMLSLPDDWVFYESEIVNHATDGKQSVRTGLKELQDAGYLQKAQGRTDGGKFGKVDWIVSDEPENVDTEAIPPSTDSPPAVKPTTVKPSTVNQPLLSTNKPSTNNTKKDIDHSSAKLTEDFEKLWRLYPNKQGKKKAFTSYCKAIKSGETNKDIQNGIVAYKKHLTANDWLKPAHGSTWFGNERWNDEYETEETKPLKKLKSYDDFKNEVLNGTDRARD